jgi:hypothetical protein
VPFYLLKKGLTTPEDLRKIAEMLGFHIDYIGFGYNFPLIKDRCKLCILNPPTPECYRGSIFDDLCYPGSTLPQFL